MRDLGMYGQEFSPVFRATHEPIEGKPGKWKPVETGEMSKRATYWDTQFRKYMDEWTETPQGKSAIYNSYAQLREANPEANLGQLWMQAQIEGLGQAPGIDKYLKQRNVDKTEPSIFKELVTLHGIPETEQMVLGVELIPEELKGIEELVPPEPKVEPTVEPEPEEKWWTKLGKEIWQEICE